MPFRPVAVEIRRLCLPFFIDYVPAGFPSSAAGYEDASLDINEHIIRHPSATYFVGASGDSMIGVGIFDGDLLVVDKSLKPEHGHIVVAEIDGQFTVKRLILRPKPSLEPVNSAYRPLPVSDDLVIWGVVTNVIHGLL